MFAQRYYSYQYSTGISAAQAIVSDMREEGETTGESSSPSSSTRSNDAAERYLDFLKSGSREYPLDLLAGAGVDMSSPEPIQRAIDVYGEYLDEMAELI